MRDTNDLHTTINLGPVNLVGQTLSLESRLEMAFPMPNQDEHLPDQIEAFVHQAGLEIQAGSPRSSLRRPTKNWSCSSGRARAAPASSFGGHAPSPSR